MKGNLLRTLALLILAFSIVSLSSCSGSKEIKDGDLAYELKMYNLAPSLLKEEAADAKDSYIRREKYKKIGDCYAFNNEPSEAIEWYEKANNIELDLDALLEIGKMYMMLEDYPKAIETFDQYIEEERFDNFSAKLLKGSAEDAMEWRSEFTIIRVSLESGLSSNKADFAPFIKGEDIVFTSTRTEAFGDEVHPWTGEKYGDLFFVNRSRKSNKAAIENFSESINTKWYEGPACFSADGKEIYFTSCGHANEEADAYCQIYHSVYDAGDWTEPTLVRLFFDTCNVGHPFLSKDGTTLYYSSDSREGYGGRDLYYSKKLDEDGWSTPYSMGRVINTPGDEMFPHIDDAGVFYFASDGHPGMGGLDLFTALQSDKGWGSVKNMKYPINSGMDDFGIAILKAEASSPSDADLKTGYFSSNRNGGEGDDDIYFFRYENLNTFEVILTAVEKDYADSTDPESEILGLKKINEFGVKMDVVSGSSDTRNDTTFKIEYGQLSFMAKEESEYKLFVSKPGYINKSTVATTVGKKTPDSVHVKVYVQVELEKIWPDQEFEIPNIYYDYNEATLRPESFPVLDSLLSFFFENEDVTIEIGSHTDSRGNFDYNEELSQRRAQSVVDYLTSKGVQSDQLVAKGYGESKLVNECSDGVECTEEEHQRNRRTTFRILSAGEEIESSSPDDIQVDPKEE